MTGRLFPVSSLLWIIGPNCTRKKKLSYKYELLAKTDGGMDKKNEKTKQLIIHADGRERKTAALYSMAVRCRGLNLVDLLNI
jgi:hypothetical protein